MTTAIAGRSSWLTRVLPGNPISRRNLPLRNGDITSPTQVDWVSGACMLVRREAFDAVGGMDQGFFLYWEDADFCRRLNDAGWPTMYLPAATAVHVGGRSSRHAADASLEAFHKSALRLYRKHASPLSSLLTPLVFVGLRARLALMKQLVKRRAG
jgi:GT2 family glycosyltransferase